MTHARSGRYTPRVPARKKTGPLASVVYGVFVVLAGAFIVSSTVQIALAVFEEPAADATSAPQGLSPACASGLKELTAAVDRGVAAASNGRDSATATKRYREARSPEWDDARQKELVRPCEGDPRGAQAVAAVSRLDRAAEGAISRQNAELGPVRRTVDSFIR